MAATYFDEMQKNRGDEVKVGFEERKRWEKRNA
jgi:hypothetical protein